jgi:RNA polymerase sigma factor (sigma-70 family)
MGSDRSLILEAMQAFQGGNEAAFGVLYESLWGPVCLRARKMGLSDDESVEISQKVLIRVYLYAGSATFPSELKLWSWVYTITAREVYKHWGRKTPLQLREDALLGLEAQPTSPRDDPANQAAEAEAVEAVGDCLGRLPPGERLPLVGTLVQGLSFRRAAAVHGLSLGQFKHRHETAMEKVRDCMRAKGFEIPDSSRTMRDQRGLDG